MLKNANRGANLATDQKFDDFNLHVEFKVPKGENSGVYLRGRGLDLVPVPYVIQPWSNAHPHNTTSDRRPST